MNTEKPKMLFVIPPCFANRELDFEIGLPVHLLLLGRVVRSQGWCVEYLDMTLEEKEGYDSFAKLENTLRDDAIKLVGISNHTVRTSVTTRTVAERIKLVAPETKIVVGGVNATFMWRELLEWCPAIDFILRGYGQPGLRALLESFEAEAEGRISGLAQRHNEELLVEPIGSVTPGDFAAPSFDGLEVARYLDWTKTYPLLTHTGCGFACNFCTSVMPGPYQNKEVYRSAEDVIIEMLAALDLGFERFFMSANIFTSHRNYCLDLCEAMRRAEIADRSAWVCMTRVEFVDEELLLSMRTAGCINIAFGVETASRDQWKSLRKGHFSEHTISNAFRLTREAGIGTTAYLMLGDPSQTQDDIEATVELTCELDPDYRVVSFFQPFPGTPYWEDPAKFGLSEIAALEEWNFHEAPICRTPNLDKGALMNAAIRLYLDRRGESEFLPTVDSLEPLIGPDQIYAGMPSPAQEALLRSNQSTSIGKVLDEIAAAHGTRGRLIALYGLSAALRDGTVQIARRQELEVLAG